MTTYYVRKTGNDGTGDGSTATPWLTISKALATMSAAGGHTLNIGDGTYAEDNDGGDFVISKNYTSPVTIQSETANPDNVTILSGGSNVSYNILIGNSANSTSNFIFNNLTFTMWSASSSNAIRLISTSGLVFNNCKILSLGAGVANDLAISGSSTISNVTLNNCSVLANSGGTGFRANISTNVNIIGGTYQSNAHPAIQFGSEASHITDAVSMTGSVKGASVTNTGGDGHSLLLTGRCDGVEVSDCNISGYIYALIIKESTNCIAKRNILTAGPATGRGLYLKGCTGADVENNTILVNYANALGLYAAIGDTGNKLANNIFIRNYIRCTNGSLMAWPVFATADAGGNIVDYNTYQVLPPATWGSINGNAVNSLPSLRAAWAGYGDGSNDSHSSLKANGDFIMLMKMMHKL